MAFSLHCWKDNLHLFSFFFIWRGGGTTNFWYMKNLHNLCFIWEKHIKVIESLTNKSIGYFPLGSRADPQCSWRRPKNVPTSSNCSHNESSQDIEACYADTGGIYFLWFCMKNSFFIISLEFSPFWSKIFKDLIINW